MWSTRHPSHSILPRFFRSRLTTFCLYVPAALLAVNLVDWDFLGEIQDVTLPTVVAWPPCRFAFNFTVIGNYLVDCVGLFGEKAQCYIPYAHTAVAERSRDISVGPECFRCLNKESHIFKVPTTRFIKCNFHAKMMWSKINRRHQFSLQIIWLKLSTFFESTDNSMVKLILADLIGTDWHFDYIILHLNIFA